MIEQIKKSLKDYNQEQVSIFLNYFENLKEETDANNQKKNKWASYTKPEDLVAVYKKVASEGLFVDGDSVTLQFRGKLMPVYNFQAYKNKMLVHYPESLIDLQLVHEGDAYSFNKKDGKVSYTHEIKNPFKKDKKIEGAYCIIKNRRGEFIEVLDPDEVQKMRNVAKTQKIWNVWEGEMWLKSIMKRACKRHFNDEFKSIEKDDNENYDQTKVLLDHEVQEKIANAKDVDELTDIHADYISKVSDETTFLKVLGDRKKQLKANDNG